MTKATTLNHTKIQQICQIVETGAVPETAAAYVGVTRRTLERWIRRGRNEEKRREDVAAKIEEAQYDTAGLDIMVADHEDVSREEQIFYDLVMALDHSLAKAEIADIAVVTAAAQRGDWKAAKFKLERRHSQRWGKKNHVEHTGKDGSSINVELSFADMIKQAMVGGTTESEEITAEVIDVSRQLEEGSDVRVPGDSRDVREGAHREGPGGDAAGDQGSDRDASEG
jgi:hypothetical protein